MLCRCFPLFAVPASWAVVKQSSCSTFVFVTDSASHSCRSGIVNEKVAIQKRRELVQSGRESYNACSWVHRLTTKKQRESNRNFFGPTLTSRHYIIVCCILRAFDARLITSRRRPASVIKSLCLTLPGAKHVTHSGYLGRWENAVSFAGFSQFWK